MIFKRWLSGPTPLERLQRDARRVRHTLLDSEAELIYLQARIAAIRRWKLRLDAEIAKLAEVRHD